MARPEPAEAVRAEIDRLAPVDLAIGLLTYNHAETVGTVLDAVGAGLARYFPAARSIVIAADAGSSDATLERVAGTALPTIVTGHEAPAGRRLQQPFGGQQALSARLVEHLLIHPKWSWQRADVSDLWITGTAIADGFAVSEAWLGRHLVRSRTRTSDLPAMIAQTLGATFTVMERHGDLWLEVRGSEPIPMIGEPAPLGAEPVTVDVAGMLE